MDFLKMVRSRMKPKHYRGQKYESLRKRQMKIKKPFNDPLFPDIKSSIGNTESIPDNLEWKRPSELCDQPCLFSENVLPEDVLKGQLSNRWFVSACAVLAGVGELRNKVVPDYSKQEWNPNKTDEYAGIFHFQFWRFGEWVDVVVDDLLPTVNGTLLFTHSTKENEFWIPLMEKAYAKLHGSYDGLHGGHMADALVDFTGGVSEIIDMRANEYADSHDKRSSLFDILSAEMRNHSLVCAACTVLNEEEFGTRTDMGLCRGTAYAVTAVKKVYLGETSLRNIFKGREKLRMVRLRDLLNDKIKSETESKGEDGDARSNKEYAYTTSQLTRLLSSSPEWSKVRESERERMGLTLDYETEFWMPLEDFVRNFSELTICRLYNTNIFALSQTWKEESIRGEWTTGVKGSLSDRAGGSSEFPETFLRNPQYLFDVRDEDEIVLQMLQWDTASVHQVAGLQKLLIGFNIIKVEENRKYRLHKQWEHNPTIVSFNYIRKREIFYKGHLPRGRYILIPTTLKPGDTGGYFVRIFSTSNIKLRTIKRDVPYKTCYCCKSGYPVWVTVVHVKGAEGLKKMDRIGSCDAYCIVKSEGKKAKTPMEKNSVNPTWNSTFVFYRSSVDEPVIIKVFNHNSCLPDNFMGQVKLPAPVNQHPSPITVDLMGKGKNEGQPTKGSLMLEIFTNDNLMMV
ncbi:calpain-5-like [Schistocerca nitens]|uniref:calpain-5-like n=1 Tax=Schistocerca nitens TaxID=7011 RepID=UPI0021188E7F|nr:calpain-5-like [Schistocerca nitens]